MKEARGKRTEENHLHRFRDNFPEFPAGQITSGEHPDFLVKSPEGMIGIEHTRYIRGELGAKEHAEDIALWLASQAYEHQGFPPVEVYVLWNFHEKPTRRAMPQFVTTLSEFVARHLPPPGRGAEEPRVPGQRLLERPRGNELRDGVDEVGVLPVARWAVLGQLLVGRATEDDRIGGAQLLQPVHPGLTLRIEPALELVHDAIHRHLR